MNVEDAASTFLYFGYTFIVVFLFFLLTGKSAREIRILVKFQRMRTLYILPCIVGVLRLFRVRKSNVLDVSVVFNYL